MTTSPSIAALISVFSIFSISASADDPISFKGQIAPLLIQHCAACHGPRKAEGSFRVDSFERLATAGDSGTPGFVAGKPEGSELLRRLIATDPDERMPKEADPLPADAIAIVRRWIEQGAKYDAANPKAPLHSILPPPVHPGAPEKYRHRLPITALEYTPDGSQLIASGYHELTIWNTADGKLARRIPNIPQRTYALRFSPDGKTLALAGGSPGRQGEVRMLAWPSGELIRVVGLTGDVAFDLAWSPSGDRLATGGADNTVRIFAAESGALLKTIDSHADWVLAVAWNADGTRLATASRDKSAKTFDAAAGTLRTTFPGHSAPVRGVAFRPDGKELFSAGSDNKLLRWQESDAKKTSDVAIYGEEGGKLLIAGESLYTCAGDGIVREIKLADSKLVRDYRIASPVLSVSCHPASKRLAAGTFHGDVRIWNLEDGKEVITFAAAP